LEDLRDAEQDDAEATDALAPEDAAAADAIAPEDAAAADAMAPEDAAAADAIAPEDAAAADASAPEDAAAADAIAPEDAAAADASAPEDAAAADASAPEDAAAADALAPDALGSDAVPPDAEPLDGGTTDFGPALDASAPDAAARDAYDYDALTPDLGLPDSGALPPIRFSFLVVQAPIQLIDGAGGDFDGNGRPDAIASTSTRTFVWFNDTAGWSRLEVAAASADRHEPIDIDLDGDLDVVAVSGGATVWLENTGRAARPWPTHPIGPAAAHLAVADVDGDAMPDVAAAGGAVVGVHLYARNATGTWVDHPVATGTFGAVALADADVDGVRDITAVTPIPQCPTPFTVTTCVVPVTFFASRTGTGLAFSTAAGVTLVGLNTAWIADLGTMHSPRAGQADSDPEPELFWMADGALSPTGVHVLQLDPTPAGWQMSTVMFYNDGTGSAGTLATGNFDTDLTSELIWEGHGLGTAFNTSISNHATAAGSFRDNGWSWPNAPIRRYHPADVDRDGLPDILTVLDRGIAWLRYLP
jgi:hypothetical protein